jgi:hypothetical protein|nr:MAG TPA: Inner membrane protein YgaP protein [Caudoviricetes sp.]
MRTRREWDIDRIARHAIGWVILAAGAGYLFFGSYHCGMARFLACAVCVGIWTAATIDDNDSKRTREGK